MEQSKRHWGFGVLVDSRKTDVEVHNDVMMAYPEINQLLGECPSAIKAKNLITHFPIRTIQFDNDGNFTKQ